MIANSRYLHASLFSFCTHAAIFLYLYGTFDTNTLERILLSKPLQVQLKFESDIKVEKRKNIIPVKQSSSYKHKKIVTQTTLVTPSILTKPQKLLLQSDISVLLEQEVDVETTKEEQEIAIISQNIIKTIEGAWMKPRNIPSDLVANLRLFIKSSGRIEKVNLIMSSGNIRFDNSALQAVRRVETFNFFNALSKDLYEKEFKIIAISFNPS
jgi:TonB family protein